MKEGSLIMILCRIRGYQTKSMSSGESKKNPKAYNNLDHMAQSLENNMADDLKESAAPEADGEAGESEERGMGEAEKA